MSQAVLIYRKSDDGMNRNHFRFLAQVREHSVYPETLLVLKRCCKACMVFQMAPLQSGLLKGEVYTDPFKCDVKEWRVSSGNVWLRVSSV